MNYVIVENNVVVNRVVSDTALFDSWIQNEEAQIGWTFDGVNFIAPPSEPESPALPTPTKEQLLAQLAELSAKINALGA